MSGKTFVQPDQRQEIVRSLVSVGVDYQRASIIADLSAQAVDEAIGKLEAICMSAPDHGSFLSSLEIALQLTSAMAGGMFENMRKLFDASNVPSNGVEIKVGSQG